MPPPAAPGDEDEIAGAASRLDTLLPLVRNTLLIADWARRRRDHCRPRDPRPQHRAAPRRARCRRHRNRLWRAEPGARCNLGHLFPDGDAFRVGEYIDTGRLRGTVEGMSLRSVRLRHQNGQVHTIPFGQVQSVTNYSRDWSVIKFNLPLEPTADIETVRKVIKRVGQELLDDPEIGAEFIQPLKMQGVIDVLQTALVVRCKFTVTPIRPTYIQRRALQRLIEAFSAAEIRFAAPNFTMQLASSIAG